MRGLLAAAGITLEHTQHTQPCRHFVDESEAALWTLKAQKGDIKSYTRPKPWEVPEVAQALEWVGPEDRCGVTKDAAVARRAHDDAYTAFVRAGES